MYTLVVLSALVAVSAAAPSGLGAPVFYSGPSLTLVEAAHPQAYVASVPTSISSHSSSVVHGAAPSLVQVHAAPLVEVKAAPAVIASVPTSVSSYSSAVVHDAKPVVAAAPVSEAVEIIETAPAVEVKAAPAAEVEAVPVAQAAVVTVPKTVSSQSSTVVHDARAVVAAPLQYVSQYAAVGPAVEVRSGPVLQYAAAPRFAPLQYAAPIAAHYSAPVAISSYSSHGLVHSAGLVASPVVSAW